MNPAGNQTSPELARHILAACGIPVSGMSFLASGAQSDAWVMQSDNHRYVLRIASSSARGAATYESDFGIRCRLRQHSGQVARPVCTSSDVNAETEREWSLDDFVAGHTVGDDQLPVTACRDLGRLLSLLHGLPVEGFGMLENRRERLAGRESDLRAALLSRLHNPWPFTGQPLEFHPVASAAPDLVRRIKQFEPQMLGLLEHAAAPSVAHSDLHPGQILVTNGCLAALLDFGDAVAAAPAWDIGSFAYFHDWNRTDQLLETYVETAAERAEIRGEAKLFALVIALHHAGRAGLTGDSRRMERALKYLRQHA